MSDTAKISVRIPAELHALLSDRVRQGQRLSDIIREALERTWFAARQQVRPSPRCPMRCPTCPPS